MKKNIEDDLLLNFDKNLEKLHERFIKRVEKRAVKLLNKFQSKISFPVEMLYCNGSFWLSNIEITADLDEELQTLALDTLSQYWEKTAYSRQVKKYFPEMIDLYRLYYAFDGDYGRPTLADLKPTVEPQKDLSRALDDKIIYFSDVD